MIAALAALVLGIHFGFGWWTAALVLLAWDCSTPFTPAARG